MSSHLMKLHLGKHAAGGFCVGQPSFTATARHGLASELLETTRRRPVRAGRTSTEPTTYFKKSEMRRDSLGSLVFLV